MNAVFSIATRGMISTSCSEAISSSSAGMTDIMRDVGNAILELRQLGARWWSSVYKTEAKPPLHTGVSHKTPSRATRVEELPTVYLSRFLVAVQTGSGSDLVQDFH